jgi:hypothetical protein
MVATKATARPATQHLADARDRVVAAVAEPAAPMPVPPMWVGAADDIAERDADSAADHALARLGGGGVTGPDAHRHGPDCSHVRRAPLAPAGPAMGMAGGGLDRATAGQIDAARSSGSALPSGTRGRMEQAFGGSFSSVRIHADDRAAQLNQRLSSAAFTTGNDIFFAAGRFDPASAAGERVLAHELAHVRQPGNRAGVQRLFTMGSKDIGRVRSVGGGLIGAVTKDTLYRLGQMLDDFLRLRKPDERVLQIDGILGLCDAYLTKHEPVEADRAKVEVVRDVQAQAMRERGIELAQAQYLGDATAAPKIGPVVGDTALKRQKPVTKPAVLAGAKALGAGTTTPVGSVVKGADAASLRLVKKYGLTEAEVLAIRTYTADDYKYINPATANNMGWLGATNLSDQEKSSAVKDPLQPDKDADADAQSAKNTQKLKSLQQEGTLHAGVAMQGLAKMPVMKGTTYRGARATQAEFDQWYGAGKTSYRFDAFASTAVKRGPAENFAKGGGGARLEQTISVMAILKVTNARDVRNLSIFGSSEEEWLLLPGATFSIDKIKEETKGAAGKPPATKWYTVHLTQTT